MPYSRPQVLCFAAMCLVVIAPAASVAAAPAEQDAVATVRLGRTSTTVTSNGSVRFRVTSPPNGREARVRTAQRARLERMIVSRSEALQKYHEARAMQADIKRANEQALARRRSR